MPELLSILSKDEQISEFWPRLVPQNRTDSDITTSTIAAATNL